MSNARNLARIIPNTSGLIPDSNIAAVAGSKVISTIPGTSAASGSVVQVVTRDSGFVNQSITSATPVQLTNMSLSITTKFPNSKILVQGMVTASWSYVSALHIFRNGSSIVGSHGGTNISGGGTSLWTHYQSSQENARANQVFPFPVLYIDSPGGIGTYTYDFRANSGWSGGTQTFYFNNRDTLDMLSSSFMTLMEIVP